MSNYKIKNDKRNIGNKTNNYLFIFSCQSKLERALIDFDGNNITIVNNDFIISSIYGDYKIINEEDVDEKNYTIIVTDIKEKYKKWKGNTAFLFKESIKHETIIYSDEESIYNILKHTPNSEIKFENASIYDLIKKASFKTKKIITINNNTIETALKINGAWRLFTQEEIEILYSYNKKNKISTDFETPLILSDYSATKDTKISISKGEIKNINSADLSDRSKWIASDRFDWDFKKITSEEGFFKFSYIEYNLDAYGFENFIRKLKNGEPIKGIEYNKVIIEGETITLSTSLGNLKVVPDYEKKKIKIWTNLLSTNEDDLSTFVKGITNNINFFINNIKDKNNNISKKNKYLISISLFTLVFMFLITFKYIFNPDTIDTAFTVIFSKENFSNPWIYIIFICTMTTFLWPLIVAYVMEKWILKKDEINFKRVMVYFYAGLLRKLTLFMTSNLIFALFIWGWYIKRENKVKTSTLVSTIAWSKIIRSIIYLIVGTIFMLAGTIGYTLKPSYGIGQESTSVILIFIMAWVGFAWEIINSSLIYILVFSPFIYAIFNHLLIKVKFIKRSVTKNYIESTYINTQSMLNKMTKFSFGRHKRTIIRFSILIMGPIFIEGIETIMYFNMMEDLFAVNFKLYWDFITLSGLRLLSNNIHNVPIINMLPGNGLVFTEFGMTKLYESIFISKHCGELAPWGAYSSEDLAQMTAFATRFFNVYLTNAIVLLSSFFVISKVILTRGGQHE